MFRYKNSLIKSILILCSCSILNTALAVTPANKEGNENLNNAIQKNIQEYYYSLALQAASWGAPIVTMYNLLYNSMLKPDAPSKPNQVWTLDQNSYPTPNVNVISAYAFLDLSREPLILSAPYSQGRYYMIQFVDMYTNSFAYVGGSATGYEGGQYVVAGPQWRGELPASIPRIVAPTPWVWLQARVHVVNENDLAEAKKVLNGITVQTFSDYNKQKSSSLVDSFNNLIIPQLNNPNISALDFKDPMQFWRILSTAINKNPPSEYEIKYLLPLFKPLGIELGKTWNPDQLAAPVLASMRLAAKNIANINQYLPIGRIDNGWFIPPANMGNFGTDYYLRSVVARLGLTANTPQEAIYFVLKSDTTGHALSGENKYTLKFKEPPYKKPGFWSLTLYNAENNNTIANPLNRFSIGSDKAIQAGPDGNLTIYVQKNSPGKSNESNWLPSGAGPFYLILRVYAPGAALIKSLSDPEAYIPPLLTK